MAKQIKLIQERPNTGVNWFDAADEFKNLKVSYVNDGKLDDQGVAMSNSDLTRTWTLVFLILVVLYELPCFLAKVPISTV